MWASSPSRRRRANSDSLLMRGGRIYASSTRPVSACRLLPPLLDSSSEMERSSMLRSLTCQTPFTSLRCQWSCVRSSAFLPSRPRRLGCVLWTAVLLPRMRCSTRSSASWQWDGPTRWLGARQPSQGLHRVQLPLASCSQTRHRRPTSVWLRCSQSMSTILLCLALRRRTFAMWRPPS